MACVYPAPYSMSRSYSDLVGCGPPLQKCRVTAHSLLGMHKDGMDTFIRSLGLSGCVTYIRGDPSCVLLLFLVSLPHRHRSESIWKNPNGRTCINVPMLL